MHARVDIPVRRVVLAQLVSDVDAVVASLPIPLRELAEHLKHQSMSQSARELGVPRRKLSGALRQLRERFTQAELRDYLE